MAARKGFGPRVRRLHARIGAAHHQAEGMAFSRALLDGRYAPSIDDVVALAGPVLRHRMALTFAARADGITVDQVVERLKAPLG